MVSTTDRLTTTISARYGLLISVISAICRLYGTHKMKTSFIRYSRLGDRSFRTSWEWIFGAFFLSIGIGMECLSYAISTFIITVPTILGTTLVLSRLYSSKTNGVLRWSDLGSFGLVTIGLILITISVRPDDIIYPPEKLSELAEKGGSITFGTIGVVFIIINVYWMYRVSVDEYVLFVSLSLSPFLFLTHQSFLGVDTMIISCP